MVINTENETYLDTPILFHIQQNVKDNTFDKYNKQLINKTKL